MWEATQSPVKSNTTGQIFPGWEYSDSIRGAAAQIIIMISYNSRLYIPCICFTIITAVLRGTGKKKKKEKEIEALSNGRGSATGSAHVNTRSHACVWRTERNSSCRLCVFVPIHLISCHFHLLCPRSPHLPHRTGSAALMADGRGW